MGTTIANASHSQSTQATEATRTASAPPSTKQPTISQEARPPSETSLCDKNTNTVMQSKLLTMLHESAGTCERVTSKLGELTPAVATLSGAISDAVPQKEAEQSSAHKSVMAHVKDGANTLANMAGSAGKIAGAAMPFVAMATAACPALAPGAAVVEAALGTAVAVGAVATTAQQLAKAVG